VALNLQLNISREDSLVSELPTVEQRQHI